MNSSKRGAVYGFKLQSLDLVTTHTHTRTQTHLVSLSQLSLWQPVINQLMLKKTDLLIYYYYWFVRTDVLCVQLLETKSTDRSQTLLHYIANMVRDKYSAVAPFYNELHYVDKAAAGESRWIKNVRLLLITDQNLDLRSTGSVDTWTHFVVTWWKKQQKKSLHWIWEVNRNVFSPVHSESGECPEWRERAATWHGTHLERVQCPTQQHAKRVYQQEWITTQQAARRRMHRQGKLRCALTVHQSAAWLLNNSV